MSYNSYNYLNELLIGHLYSLLTVSNAERKYSTLEKAGNTIDLKGQVLNF